MCDIYKYNVEDLILKSILKECEDENLEKTKRELYITSMKKESKKLNSDGLERVLLFMLDLNKSKNNKKGEFDR